MKRIRHTASMICIKRGDCAFFVPSFSLLLKKILELFCEIYDIIHSIPAKPLLKSTLKCGGSFFLWGPK